MLLRLAVIHVVLTALCAAQTAGWKLVWADEFSGDANTGPDPAKWAFDLGNGPPPGWGNQELEIYTSSTANCFQDGSGHLVIQALHDNAGYTSARIKTLNKFNFTYGKIEARIKLPYALGIWPAFWLLGANPALGWPAGGEIDVAENFGVQNNDASVNHATIHGPNYAGAGVSSTYRLPGTEPFSADFHLFAVDWEPGRIEFSVDGHSFFVVTPASLPQGGQWVFDDNPMFILLNLAVGGSPAPVGYPNETTVFPQQMLIDYVRVYQKASLDGATPNIAPNGIVDAAGFRPFAAPGALATVYGNSLSDSAFDASALFDSAANAFVTATDSGVRVLVNGRPAPLLYVSDTQINFQVPWATPSGRSPVDVEVVRGAISSSAESLAVLVVAPAVYSDYAAGVALVTICAGGKVIPGATCVMWGNGFGPKNSPQQDGVPAAATSSTLFPLEVPGAPASCALNIGGQPATVLYCGAAPGELIDQLNFTYPDSLPGAEPSVDAVLTIGNAGVKLVLPVSR